MPCPSCLWKSLSLVFGKLRLTLGVGGDEQRMKNYWWSCSLELPGVAGRAVSFHLGEAG